MEPASSGGAVMKLSVDASGDRVEDGGERRDHLRVTQHPAVHARQRARTGDARGQAVRWTAEGHGALANPVRAGPCELGELVEEVERPEPRPDDVPVGVLGEEAEIEHVGQRTVQRAGLLVLRSARRRLLGTGPGRAGLGYLLEERIGDDDGAIAPAIREVVAGRSVIDPEVVDGLVTRQSKARSSPLHRLPDRERDVLAQMAQGKTNEAIAESLHLHRATVEKHISSILSAFDLVEGKQVSKRVVAVLLFLRDA
jgi:DNA-binding CsgD family transcriptional regulator